MPCEARAGMKLCLVLSLCAFAGCLSGSPDDEPIDEDVTASMVELDMPVSVEASTTLHRILATPHNLETFRHGCYHDVVILDWSCAAGIDGRNAGFDVKREVPTNATETADNHGFEWGQCVSLVKAATKSNVLTGDWRPGAGVFDGLASGTAIATFPGGHYDGHTAIFLRYVKDSGGHVIGIRVADQNWNGMTVKRHLIRRSGTGVVNADNYRAVLVP